MIINETRFLLGLASLIMLAACYPDSSLQEQSVNSPKSSLSPKLETLHTSSQCGSSSVTTQWISSQQQLENLLQATQRMMISASPQQAPKVDFTQYGVLMVSMGQQRTGGYSIRLTREDLPINSGSAEVEVQWQEPESGMILTQAITHPCIFIKVPRGEYQLVRVVDQEKKLRAEISVN